MYTKASLQGKRTAYLEARKACWPWVQVYSYGCYYCHLPKYTIVHIKNAVSRVKTGEKLHENYKYMYCKISNR